MKPQRLALVLSGGGMKAMAHIGVLRALEQHGLAPASIAATSAGAMIAALYAAGRSYEELVRFATGLRPRDVAVLDRAALLLKGVGARSLLRPDPLRTLLRRVLPGFEGLRVPLRIAVTDMDSGRAEVFGTAGRTDCALADVVYASMALPPYLPPTQIGSSRYADGGLLNVLPLELVEGDPDLVLASDVGPVHAGHPAWPTQAPAMVALMDRSLSLMMAEQKARQEAAWRADPARPPLLVVEPAVDPYGTFSFDHAIDSIEAGYRAAHTALESR